jgi:hypothetical protein
MRIWMKKKAASGKPDPLDSIKDPKMRAAAEYTLRKHRKALDMLAKL